MKTKNETVERSSLIELILTPEMSIEEFQDICKKKIRSISQNAGYKKCVCF